MGSGSLASSRRSAHARNSIIPCRQVPAGDSAHPIANPAPGPTFVTPGPSLVCYAPEHVVHATARQVPQTIPAIGIACVNKAAPTQEHTSSGRQLTALPTGVYGQLTYMPPSGREVGIQVLFNVEGPYLPNPVQPMSGYAIQLPSSDSETSNMQKLLIDMRTLV